MSNDYFIPRNGSPLFFPEDPEFGFSSASSGPSRRKFLKRTGGATMATMLTWSLQSRARAGSEDPDPNVSGTLHSAYFNQYKMVCSSVPPYTDGSVTWNEATWSNNLMTSTHEGYSTLKGSGPYLNEVQTGKMTAVKGKVLATILGSPQLVSAEYSCWKALKMGEGENDPYYGGDWLESTKDQPKYIDEKDPENEEPLDWSPNVNLEVQAMRVAMNFSHSGNFDSGITSVTQGSNNAISTHWSANNHNQQNTFQAAEGQLGWNTPDIGIELSRASMKVEKSGGLTAGVKYESKGSSQSTQNYNKSVDEDNVVTWTAEHNYTSLVTGSVEANWVIELWMRRKRVGYKDGVEISNTLVHDWQKITIPPDPEVE